MKWVEIVRLRALEGQEKVLRPILRDATKNTSDKGLTKVRFYKNASFQSDISVTFDWDTGAFEARGSRTALSIAQILKAYGLVEHSVWFEYDPSGLPLEDCLPMGERHY